MSDKIIITYPDREDNKTRKIDLASVVGTTDILFRITENEKFCVRLESSSQKAKIQNQYYMNLSDQRICRTQDEYLELIDGETYMLSDPGDENLYYNPGIYHLKVKNSYGYLRDYTFEITMHQSMSQQGYASMLSGIEETINGLVLNIFRNGNNAAYAQFPNRNDLLALTDRMKETEDDLLRKINAVIANFKTMIVNSYRRSTDFGKQNPTTLRKNILSSVKNDGMYYSVHKEVSYDCPENQMLKYYLRHILDVLSLYLNKTDDIAECYEKRNQAIDDELKISKKSSLRKALTQEKKGNVEMLPFLYDFQKTINRSIQNLNRLYEDEKMRNVTLPHYITNAPSFYYDPNYFFFKNYNSQILKSSTVGYHKGYAIKRSTVLFEIYGYTFIQKVLLDCGFVFLSSNVSNFFQFQENASMFAFENDRHRVLVQYGHYCRDRRSETDSDVITLNSSHVSPDYLIEFFSKETDELESIIVFEVKYRALSSLYSSTEDMDLMKNFIDYLQLGFRTEEGKVLRGKVNRCFVFYPDLNNTIKEEDDIEITYLGNNPETKIKDSPAYMVLKNHIQSALDEK